MKPSDPLLLRLTEQLALRHPPLVGCPRQNVWAPERAWRYVRGNAVLSAIGTKLTISAPFGAFDIYATRDDRGWIVLQFRGGEWRPWFEDDAKLLGALILLYSDLRPSQIAFILENRGALTARYISPPEADDARRLVADALAGWPGDPPPRIAKNTPRARVLCPYCPAYTRCQAADLETGATGDWVDL